MRKSNAIQHLLVVGCLSACTTWEVQSASPQQVLTDHQLAKVRVTRTDSTTLVVKEPQIVGDTLFGIGQSNSSGPEHIDRHAIALTDIDRIAIRKTDATSTVLVGLGSAALAGGIGFMIWASTMPED